MVYRIEKTTRTVIYLKKAILIRSGSTKNYPIRNIKCTGKEEKINSLREGMHVRLEGMLVLPELPRNPGQFNRRIYESGKKIDFYLENPTVLEVKEQRSGVRSDFLDAFPEVSGYLPLCALQSHTPMAGREGIHFAYQLLIINHS